MNIKLMGFYCQIELKGGNRERLVAVLVDTIKMLTGFLL